MINFTINSVLTLLMAVNLVVMPTESKSFNRELEQESKLNLGYSALSRDHSFDWGEELKMESISEKIIRYSALYGADTELALNVACAESCTRNEEGYVFFNKMAKNPNSTASGVYQFIEGTWNYLCEGDVFSEDDNVRCGVKVLAKEGGIKHWEASKNEGFGGGWSKSPYREYEVIN